MDEPNIEQVLQEIQSAALSEETKHFIEHLVRQEIFEVFGGKQIQEFLRTSVKDAAHKLAKDELQEYKKKGGESHFEQVLMGRIWEEQWKGYRGTSKIEDMISKIPDHAEKTLLQEARAAVRKKVETFTPEINQLMQEMMPDLVVKAGTTLSQQVVYYWATIQDLVLRVQRLESQPHPIINAVGRPL